MNDVRARADIARGAWWTTTLWPLPKYHELLFIH